MTAITVLYLALAAFQAALGGAMAYLAVRAVNEPGRSAAATAAVAVALWATCVVLVMEVAA